MRVGLDVRTITPVRSGVGNYVLHLFRGLRNVAPEQDFFLVGQRSNLDVIGGGIPDRVLHETKISHENHPLGDLWEHYWLPRVLHQNQVDVFHGPATLLPLARDGYAAVVTIHDLVAFLHPQTIPRKYATYMRWLIRKVVARADRIISVSEHTKSDLVDVLGVNPDKISVVYEAAHESFRPCNDQKLLDDVCQRYGLDGPFLYHVGNIEPRKNLVRLVKAFMIMRERSGHKVKLAISGQKGWLTRRLFKALGEIDIHRDVVFTGYVSHQDLPLLMCAAHAFVFPSLYEGFGLPVLEAMSCGTPVVTSDISSLPEIVGDKAVLVDPNSSESVAQGLQRILEDSQLHSRLAAEGFERAKLFSWNKAARETLDIYRRVHEERKAG